MGNIAAAIVFAVLTWALTSTEPPPDSKWTGPAMAVAMPLAWLASLILALT